MNKIIASFVGFSLVLSFFGMFISVAHADTVCGNPSQSNSQTTFIACGNGSPENVVTVYGKNSEVPQVNPGTKALFQFGNIVIDLGCPAYFTQKCNDVTVTQYWITTWGIPQGLTRVK